MPGSTRPKTPHTLDTRGPSPLDRDLRRQLLDAANNNTFERVLEGNDEVIKWYHDNGVPQVKKMPAGMFKRINMF